MENKWKVVPITEINKVSNQIVQGSIAIIGKIDEPVLANYLEHLPELIAILRYLVHYGYAKEEKNYTEQQRSDDTIHIFKAFDYCNKKIVEFERIYGDLPTVQKLLREHKVK